MTPAELHELIWRHYIAPIRVEPSQWVRENINIDKRQSADYAGLPMSLDATPHASIIYDFLADAKAEELNVMKSSAAAMTSTLIAACFYMLATNPKNILYLIGNREEAKKMSERYWRVWFRQVFGKRMADSEDQAALHLKVNGVDLISGSPTEKLMRGIQYALIIEDESDTLPEKMDGGQSLDVAEDERTKNTRRRKIIRLSTPLFAYNEKRTNIVQEGTRIHRHWMKGDRREYRCPCPGCGSFQTINYDDLHTPGPFRGESGELLEDFVIETTFWRCPQCKKEVKEGNAKERMVRKGKWFATVPGNGRIWSAQHTDMCAIIGNATWGRIKQQMEVARGTPQEAGVRRAYLAQPEDRTGDYRISLDMETVLRHCGDYARGTCPVIPWHVGMYVDVQKNCERFPWIKAALLQDGTTYILDWGEAGHFDELFMRDRGTGIIHGLYSAPLPLRISAYDAATYFNGNPPPFVYTTRALMDSGYRARGGKDEPEDGTEEGVYRYCSETFDPIQNRYLICPAKGQAGRQIAVPTRVTFIDYNRRQLPLHFYDDYAWKRILYNIRLASNPAEPSAAARDHPRIHFPRREDLEKDHMESDDGESLISQLLSERIVTGEYVTAAGARKYGPHWHNAKPNDFGDCVKGQLIIYAFLSELARQKYAGQTTADNQHQ